MNEVIQMMLYGAPDIYDYLAASCPQPHLHACEMKGFVSRVPTKGNHQKNMTKPNSHIIFPQKPALQRMIKWELQHKEGNYTLEKARNLSKHLKEESHMNRILTLTTKITGNHN